MSEALLGEYRRVLSYERVRAYLQVSDRELDEVFQQFERHGIVAVPSDPLHVVDDPADNIVLECAIAGAADFIVSGDIHLLALGEYEGVRIIRPRAFVDDVLAAMRHDP